MKDLKRINKAIKLLNKRLGSDFYHFRYYGKGEYAVYSGVSVSMLNGKLLTSNCFPNLDDLLDFIFANAKPKSLRQRALAKLNKESTEEIIIKEYPNGELEFTENESVVNYLDKLLISEIFPSRKKMYKFILGEDK